MNADPLPKSNTERKVYSISEITREVRNLLEGEFGEVWVEGEVSNFRRPAFGHSYFTLKDENAQIRAVLFRRAARLRFKLEDGLKIRVFGKVSVYEKRGDYQIICEIVEPVGLGELQLAFEQLKKKLHAEGLFDPERKKPLPMLPTRIGIVTSPTGAAIRDILNILDRRFANLHILIAPCRVQGDEAPGEISEAIRLLNRLRSVDVIIAGRGGGSLEDLWAFNTEEVARAIAASEIPVISAVGHEIDFTIADFVADLRAPTPSAAAELVIGEREEIEEQIKELTRRLAASLSNALQTSEHRLEMLLSSIVFQRPLEMIQQRVQEVDDLTERVCEAVSEKVEDAETQRAGFARHLEALSPLRVLARGYSITERLPDGRFVRQASEVSEGNQVRIRLHDGQLICTVDEKP